MERHAPSTGSYPHMALELARTVAVCDSLSSGAALFIESPVSRMRCEDAVISALGSRTMGTHRSVVIESLSVLMLAHIEEVLAGIDEPTESQVEDLRQVVKFVREGGLVKKLGQVWDGLEYRGGVDDTVALFNEKGWRAQDISWAIITFETHRHINLVWHQANKLERTFPDRQASDLFGWGWVGLRAALRNYDPELGFTFSTYACTRITGFIRDGVRSENPVPKRLVTYARKVARAEEDLVHSLGRQPSLEEVASHLGQDLSTLAIMPRLSPTASVDEIVATASEHGGIPSWLIDSCDPADAALSSERAEAIAQALELLPPDDRDAVKLLVMEALSPTEARIKTGATARQMRQRRERGLATLKDLLVAWAE